MLSSYLRFINYTGTPAVDLDTLTQLHYLHSTTFAFENITPFSGELVSLEPQAIQNKFLSQQRGGYCFEQNMLFEMALKEIGFQVRGLGARVIWNQPEDAITRRSHMLLEVELDRKTYLADVGFGGLTLTTPLEFEVDKDQKTSHEVFRIGKLDDDFKLEAKVGDQWKSLYRFDLQEQHHIDYEVANFYICKHPSSIFINSLMAGLPTDKGRFALSNKQLTFYGKDGEVNRSTIQNVPELKQVLQDVFKLKVPENKEFLQSAHKLFDA